MNEIQLVVPNTLTIGKDNAAEIFKKVKVVEEQLKTIKAAVDSFARPLLLEKEEVPGLALRYGTPRRSISDVKRAYQAVKGVIPTEDFTEICKIGVGDLEKLYKKNTELSQTLATKELMDKLGDAVEMKESDPVLILTE